MNHGELPFHDHGPPTTGSVQLGIPLPQAQSLLFTLPIELRQRIYEYVCGPSLIHMEALTPAYGGLVRLAYLRCQDWKRDDGWSGHTHWRDMSLDHDLNDQLFSLCFTCRRIYREALPFLLSVPLYTISDPPSILAENVPRLGTFIHIRNLNMMMYFYDFPELMHWHAAEEPYTMTGWNQICDTLASMTSLRYLCIRILQVCFTNYFVTHSSRENADIVRKLLRPLRSITVPKEGVFDVVAQEWEVPEGAVEADAPFRVIQNRPPTIAELAGRTYELGEFSVDSYVKLVSMPWPIPLK